MVGISVWVQEAVGKNLPKQMVGLYQGRGEMCSGKYSGLPTHNSWGAEMCSRQHLGNPPSATPDSVFSPGSQAQSWNFLLTELLCFLNHREHMQAERGRESTRRECTRAEGGRSSKCFRHSVASAQDQKEAGLTGVPPAPILESVL